MPVAVRRQLQSDCRSFQRYGLVIPVVFSSSSKSRLGWQLVGLIESGRLKDYADDAAEETRLFWKQLAAVGYEVRPGPGKLLRWGVAGYPPGGWRCCTMIWC